MATARTIESRIRSALKANDGHMDARKLQAMVRPLVDETLYSEAIGDMEMRGLIRWSEGGWKSNACMAIS